MLLISSTSNVLNIDISDINIMHRNSIYVNYKCCFLGKACNKGLKELSIYFNTTFSYN